MAISCNRRQPSVMSLAFLKSSSYQLLVLQYRRLLMPEQKLAFVGKTIPYGTKFGRVLISVKSAKIISCQKYYHKYFPGKNLL